MTPVTFHVRKYNFQKFGGTIYHDKSTYCWDWFYYPQEDPYKQRP